MEANFLCQLSPQEKVEGLYRSASCRAYLITAVILFISSVCHAQVLTASYYSVASLKAEGTYKYSKGVMANGKLFKDTSMVCASNDYRLGDILRIVDLDSSKSIQVVVSDRTAKRFKGKRIDLSKGAMFALGGQRALDKGLIKVRVEKWGI